MPKNFKKVLEAIPEEDVANYRMNNKKFEISEEIEVRNLLAGDYWKYVYTAKCIHKNYSDWISHSKDSLDILSNYIEEDSYTLRCIINAVACKIHDGKSSFPLENLSVDEFQAAIKLYVFSIRFGYYLWDIDNICTSVDIINFFIKNNSMPLPPLPFCNNQEQRARVITYRLFSGSIFTGGKSYVEEMKNKDFHPQVSYKYHDDNFENKIKFFQLDYEMTCFAVEQTVDGEPRPTSKVAEFIRMRKCLVQDEFHSNSNAARCIGLLMYDTMASPEENIETTVKNFRFTDTYSKLDNIRIFKKSNNPFISDKDNLTLKRWLKTTKECIEKMSVLTVK